MLLGGAPWPLRRKQLVPQKSTSTRKAAQGRKASKNASRKATPGGAELSHAAKMARENALIVACRENPAGVLVVDVNLDSSVEHMTAYLGSRDGLELQTKLLDTEAVTAQAAGTTQAPHLALALRVSAPTHESFFLSCPPEDASWK